MALNFLITGTDAGVGKTMAGCALAFAFKVRGMRVGVMKAVETGCLESGGVLKPRDGPALTASASSDLPIDLVSPYRYRSSPASAAAAAADGIDPPNFDSICAKYREIASRSDVTIVEDSGGLAAPIDWQHNYADLALDLGLALILIVANRGGFLNASALTLDYAARRNVPVRGFIVNALDRDASTTVHRDAEFVTRITDVPCLGTVRFKEPVSLAIVERLL